MNHLSTQNVNIARFARNVECDFLGDFQHCVLTSKYFKLVETPCSKLSVEVKGKVAVPIKVFFFPSPTEKGEMRESREDWVSIDRKGLSFLLASEGKS